MADFAHLEKKVGARYKNSTLNLVLDPLFKPDIMWAIPVCFSFLFLRLFIYFFFLLALLFFTLAYLCQCGSSLDTFSHHIPFLLFCFFPLQYWVLQHGADLVWGSAHQGEPLCLSDWCHSCSVSYHTGIDGYQSPKEP